VKTHSSAGHSKRILVSKPFGPFAKFIDANLGCFKITWAMIHAQYTDKNTIVKILAEAFDNNLSVNYVVAQDKKRKVRVKRLMEFSFDICIRFGTALLSDNKKGCALIVHPEKKKIDFRFIRSTFLLIFNCTGFFNIKKNLSRESAIKARHPLVPMNYLWFIGVHPASQNAGIGTGLLREIIELSETSNKMICLETSNPRNLSWYKKFDFEIYDTLNFGFPLHFLKRDAYTNT
jgi:hypothetical protein